MAEAAGIYNHLWHPEKVGVFCAKDLIKPLEKGLDNLKSNPKKFKKYNPANGWGNYDNLVAFVTNYLVACKTYPNAVISISR
jgi:hypothetical protein